MIPNNVNAIVFDCDGVLLESNKLKTQAFYKVALPYGVDAANALVSYHVKNGGISRNHKFKYFVNKILSPGAARHEVEELVSEYANEVYKGLMLCKISPCLFKLREKTPNMKWFVASGGAQDELKKVFRNRLIFDLFDGGIYGSPKEKDEILNKLIDDNILKLPSVFLGDSKYDYEVSQRTHLDFIFISEWSDFQDWQGYCDKHKITSAKSLCSLV